MFKKIQAAFRKKKDEKTIKEFTGQVLAQPNDTRSRLKLGDLLIKAGRKQEAIEQYTASASIFAEAGFHLKAIALYKQILKLSPNSMGSAQKGGAHFVPVRHLR